MKRAFRPAELCAWYLRAMIKKLAIFAAGALAIAGTAAVSMPPADQWIIGPLVKGKNYSVNMPFNPDSTRDGHVVFDFPRHGRGEVDAMTTGVYPLAGKKRIVVDYRIDAAPGTRFIPVERPELDALVSIYFQRAGDKWNAKGKYASYRWYQPVNTVHTIRPGRHRMVIELDDRWTNVWGKPNTENRALYQAALADTATLGIAFGSHSGRSHGVAATGDATFTLLSVEIE